jgi:hypothetical protein
LLAIVPVLAAKTIILAAKAIKKKENTMQVLWLVLGKIAKGEIKLVRVVEKASYFNVSKTSILLIAPVVEEILFRYLFHRVWHGSARLINRLKRCISKSTQETKIDTTDMANELSRTAQRFGLGTSHGCLSAVFSLLPHT